MSIINQIELVLWPVVGVLLGAFYFFMLHRVVCLITSHTAATLIIPLHLTRVGVTLVVLWIIALQGAVPLLLVVLGFVVARRVAQRSIGLV